MTRSLTRRLDSESNSGSELLPVPVARLGAGFKLTATRSEVHRDFGVKFTVIGNLNFTFNFNLKLNLKFKFQV